MFQYFSVNSGVTAILPDTGIYVLRSSQLAVEGDSLLVHINYGMNIDTIKQVDIREVIQKDYSENAKGKEWSGWFCCGKKCEGYKVDYYYNGNKHMEGKFRNGKPVGDLKFYDESGKLKYLEHYNKRGKKISSQQLANH